MPSDKSKRHQHFSSHTRYSVPPLQLETEQKFDNLVSEITATRNQQPTIVSSDLLSEETGTGVEEHK